MLGSVEQLDGFKRTALYVGSNASRGRGPITVDGGGITLRIERAGDGAYSGAWTSYGIAANGSGSWHAVRME